MEYREDLQRSAIPEKYKNLGSPERRAGTAGRLAPAGVRRRGDAPDAGRRPARRDLPDRAPRLLLGGLVCCRASCIPSRSNVSTRAASWTGCPATRWTRRPITFIRHTGTTGAAAPTAEGTAKPELVFNVDQITRPAVKIAAHNGLSWEIINDWPAFQTYCGTELYKQVIDVENDQTAQRRRHRTEHDRAAEDQRHPD